MMTFWAMRGGMGGTSNVVASADAAAAKGEARAVGREVADVEARLDRTLMACEAMWTILREKLDLTDEDLIDRINEVDMSDGKLDGKVRREPVSCPKCGRAMSRRFPKCMYCGQAVQHEPFS